MMLYLEQILLHFFIILGPIIFYQMYKNDERFFPSSWKPQKIFFFLILGSTIMLFHFPLLQIGYFSFDFQSLLIMYTLLYCNKRLGVTILLIITVYRLFLNVNDGMISILLFPFVYTIPMLLQSSWDQKSKKIKYIFSLMISFVAYFFFFIILWAVLLVTNLRLITVEKPIVIVIFTGICYCLVFLIMIMITEFLRENRRLKRLAHDSEKMMVVSELAAGVAHEVRNPLTVVKGFVQLVEKEVDDTSKTYMKLVLSEIDRAESIITDYLHLAKKNNLIQSNISVTEMLKTVHSVMSSFTNINGITLSLKIEDDLYIAGDPSKMKQVCYNIIKNAAEAIPHAHGEITLRSYASDMSAIIEFSDNGIGMDDKELNRIGEPFYTNKESGTGLGVMVTKSIIEEHDGVLDFQSEKDKGTVVTIRIPKLEKDKI